MKNPRVNSIAMCQWRILVLIVWLHILTCKMFSSTMDCRWRIQCFPQDLNRLSPFNPLDCLPFILRQVQFGFLHFRLLVYKWSPVYPALSGRILHWQTAWSKCLNKALLILSNLELLALPYVAPIIAISRFQEYQLYCVHEIVWCSCGKVICHSQKYTTNHRVMRKGSPWTLRNHFIQSYRR